MKDYQNAENDKGRKEAFFDLVIIAHTICRVSLPDYYTPPQSDEVVKIDGRGLSMLRIAIVRHAATTSSFRRALASPIFKMSSRLILMLEQGDTGFADGSKIMLNDELVGRVRDELRKGTNPHSLKGREWKDYINLIIAIFDAEQSKVAPEEAAEAAITEEPTEE